MSRPELCHFPSMSGSSLNRSNARSMPRTARSPLDHQLWDIDVDSHHDGDNARWFDDHSRPATPLAVRNGLRRALRIEVRARTCVHPEHRRDCAQRRPAHLIVSVEASLRRPD